MVKEVNLNGLPDNLKDAIEAFILGEQKAQENSGYLDFDCDYCLLQSEINNAEVNRQISADQAWELRSKYLGLSRME